MPQITTPTVIYIIAEAVYYFQLQRKKINAFLNIILAYDLHHKVNNIKNAT